MAMWRSLSRPLGWARTLALGVIIVAMPAVGAGPSAQSPAGVRSKAAEPLIVFAAASLRNALDDILIAWQQETKALAVVSYAGTPTLARQIQAGAPADVFISADQLWMDTMTIDGQVDPASVRPVARNRLVLIAPASSGSASSARAKKSAQGSSVAGVDRVPQASATLPIDEWLGADGRLAMADAESVPAGRYARDALTAIGWYERVAARVTHSNNVRLALALVARGECPVGVVYASDAAVEPRVRVLAHFAEDAHARIEYPAARVTASRHPRAAAFLDWLQTPAATAIFVRSGFSGVR